MTHGKLCSGLDDRSLEASNRGSKQDLVLESLFGALWRPLLGGALENSWLQGNPKRNAKGGSKMRPPFWEEAGPPKSLKPLKIRTRSGLVLCPLENTPVPPSTGGGGFSGSAHAADPFSSTMVFSDPRVAVFLFTSYLQQIRHVSLKQFQLFDRA